MKLPENWHTWSPQLAQSLWYRPDDSASELWLACPFSRRQFTWQQAIAVHCPLLQEPLTDRALRISAWRDTGRAVNWRITDICTLRCQHCYRPAHHAYPQEEADASVVADIPAGMRALPPAEISVTGGDTALSPATAEALRRLRQTFPQARLRLLLAGVAVRRRRHFPQLLTALVDCHITTRLSFYGASETVHDSVTRAPGNLHDTLALADDIRQAGGRVEAAWLAHRRNYHELPALLALMDHHFPLAHSGTTLCYPLAAGATGMFALEHRQFEEILQRPAFAAIAAEYLSASACPHTPCHFPAYGPQGKPEFCEVCAGGLPAREDTVQSNCHACTWRAWCKRCGAFLVAPSAVREIYCQRVAACVAHAKDYMARLRQQGYRPLFQGVASE